MRYGKLMVMIKHALMVRVSYGLFSNAICVLAFNIMFKLSVCGKKTN